MKLFKRFPKLIWHPGKPDPVISKEVQARYQALKDDFDTLDRVLVPIFQKVDEQALKFQNQFRGWQVFLILGGALATILGALQATFDSAPWPGISEAILAVILATVTSIVRQLKFQEQYFHNRLKAEVLRREYFLFLGRVAPYDKDESRAKRLAIWAEEIESEGDL
jgi:hypothetical protein